MDNHVFETYQNEITSTSFKLNIYLTEKELNLTIFLDGDAWKASVSEEDLKIQAHKHNISLEDYIINLKNLLVEAKDNATFLVNNSNFSINKLIKNNKRKVTVKYFNCDLVKEDYQQETQHLLDKFYANLQVTSKQLDYLEKQNKTLKENEEKYKNKLIDFENKKKVEEEEMLHCVRELLNEKKARIQHLYGLLDRFREKNCESSKTELNNQVEARDLTCASKRKEISDSESDVEEDDYSTDAEKYIEDDDDNEQMNKPGTSKQVIDYLFKDDYPQFSKRTKLLTPQCSMSDKQQVRKINNENGPVLDSVSENVIQNFLEIKDSAIQETSPKPDDKDCKVEVGSNTKDLDAIDINTQDLLDLL